VTTANYWPSRGNPRGPFFFSQSSIAVDARDETAGLGVPQVQPLGSGPAEQLLDARLGTACLIPGEIEHAAVRGA
jgi:hypothetical protein